MKPEPYLVCRRPFFLRECPYDKTKWTAPSILDMKQPDFEAASNASGLIPSSLIRP